MQTQKNIDLKNYTTLQIGGPAKQFTIVKSEDELIESITYSKKNNLNFLIIGGGSNLLVSDEGIDSFIIKNEITGIQKQGNTLKVKSGTILQDLVDFSIKEGLSGLNKMTGIPGTVGGAVYGNAGAYGQTISDNLTKVIVFDGEKIKEFSKKDCQFNYRYSIFKQNHFTLLEIHFELTPGNSQDLEQESQQTLEKRLIKYPPGIKCPGSFFQNIVASTLPQEILKNIPEDKIMYGKIPAGSLLEEVGTKGDQLGQIKIAPYHANLFINEGGGTAKDFYELAKKYSQKVHQKYGITLNPEVQFINLPPLNT